MQGQDAILQLRDVNVEDLLRRTPARLNMASIAHYVEDRIVLVTGAGGSIGSEIVRQVARFRPRQLILLGRGENSIFSIQQELRMNWPEVMTVSVIADVRSQERLRQVFAQHRPEVVYHAAAHKHVPLMEDQPGEAVLNNVFGTKNVAELCLEFGIKRFVNISTDKAVNPTSVMGSTKRLAEMVVSTAAQRAQPGQAFMSVRFGNVLGSRGSVVPTFMAQIRAGGPVTVTHPEMVRYFMTIPEAARLVLQAGGLASNSSVYILDMGQPVKIVDLARDVVQLSGAKDIERGVHRDAPRRETLRGVADGRGERDQHNPPGDYGCGTRAAAARGVCSAAHVDSAAGSNGRRRRREAHHSPFAARKHH